jgi:hypothetical protein
MAKQISLMSYLAEDFYQSFVFMCLHVMTTRQFSSATKTEGRIYTQFEHKNLITEEAQ